MACRRGGRVFIATAGGVGFSAHPGSGPAVAGDSLRLEDQLKRQLKYQVCSVIAALTLSGAAAQAAGIATVTVVENAGYRTPPGREELSAKQADELVQNEALRTEADSTIQVKFLDGSELSVEPRSDVVLSNYVFDGSASSGLINLNGGVFRFQSHGVNDQGVNLRTPVATIGIRGTEIVVHVNGSDATIVDILSGAVEATPHGAGKSIVCVGGQSMLVSGPDANAICGDLGTFSTAAGPSDRDNKTGHGGERDKERREPKAPDRPEPDPDSEGGEGGSGSFLLFEGEELKSDYV